MSLDGDIELLSGVPLFSELTVEHMRLLAFSVGHRDLAPGEALFNEGDAAASGFVVAAGTIELSRGPPSHRQTVDIAERGVLIGELALFVATRRPVTAIASGASGVLEVGRPLMLRMLNEYPDVARKLRARIAERLRGTVADLRQVQRTLLSIGGR